MSLVSLVLNRLKTLIGFIVKIEILLEEEASFIQIMQCVTKLSFDLEFNKISKFDHFIC